MIIILLRKGAIHAVHRNSATTYRTYCGLSYSKNQKRNTLAASDTFPGLCPKCKWYCDETYKDDLEHEPRIARSEPHARYFGDLVDTHRYNLDGPQMRYGDIPDRYWPKLIKYQRLLKKSKKR